MFNENYHQEYERTVLEVQQLAKEIHEMTERMERPEEGFTYYRNDPHFKIFEKQREAMERLRKVSEHYFGAH